MENDRRLALERARQKTILMLLAGVLLLAGMVVLLFLKRVPLPLRIAIGVGDLIAAWTLLVLLRQKFNK